MVTKRYFLLKFICKSMDCSERLRLDELEFDFMGRGHCSNCKGIDFEIFKEFQKHELIGEDTQIVMIETKKLIDPRK